MPPYCPHSCPTRRSSDLITDSTDYSTKKPTDFPIMEDFYKLCEAEFMTYDKQRKYLYTEETLQQVCLGIHSMRSEEHTSELQSRGHLVCRLLLAKQKSTH